MRKYVSQVSIVSNEEMTCYLLSKDDVLKEISKVVKEIGEILGLSSSTIVRLLLNYFHWDKNTLTGRIKVIPRRKKPIHSFFRSLLGRSGSIISNTQITQSKLIPIAQL